MKNIVIKTSVVLFLFSGPVFAQYAGGPGDGGASAISAAEPAGLDNSSPSSRAIDLPSENIPTEAANIPAVNDAPRAEDGLQKKHYDNGKIKSSINYINGKKEGTAKFYSREGKLIKELYYRNDAIMGMKGFQKTKPDEWALPDFLNPSVDFQALRDRILTAPELILAATPFVQIAALLVLIVTVLIFVGFVSLALFRTDTVTKIRILGGMFIMAALPGLFLYPLTIETAKYPAYISVAAAVLVVLLGSGILLRSNVARLAARGVTVAVFVLFSVYFLVSAMNMIAAMVQYSMSLAADARALMIVSCSGMILTGIIWRVLTLPDVIREFVKSVEEPNKTHPPQPVPPASIPPAGQRF